MKFGYNTLVIIMLVICVLIIAYAIWKSARTDNKQINSDVPTQCTGSNCKIECGVLSYLTIKECENTEDGQKICKNCKCDESGRLSGCMTCKESDPSTPSLLYSVELSTEECKDPFQWNAETGTCDLKKGFFCLPQTMNTIDCNPYTGRQLLRFNPTNSVYEWTCVCKDTTKFSGKICDQINVCGMEGSVNNPDNYETGRGLINTNNHDDYWNKNSTWDPLAIDSDGNYINSSCDCRSNEFADNKNLLCLPNNCYPGSNSSVDPEFCDCNCKGCGGLVDCKSISASYDGNLTYYNSLCKIPSCVPDPCGGPDGLFGKYTVEKDKDGIVSGKCICNPGYDLIQDPSYYGGFRCAKLCADNSICGNRGTCVIKPLNKFSNFTIICKDQNQSTGECGGSGLFFIKYKLNDKIYYLNYDKDNKKLSLDRTQNPDSYFSFKIRSCDSKYTDQHCKYTIGDNKITSGLISGNYYYLMIGDKFLIFNNDINNIDLADDSDNLKEKSLFLFTSLAGNKRPYPVIDGTILFDSIKKYLSVSTSLSLFYESSIKSPEQCDCNPGYGQDPNDPNQRCLRECSYKGRSFYSRNRWNNDDIYKLCCNGGEIIDKSTIWEEFYQLNCN